MARESVFTFEATPIKFGPGAAADAGWELSRLGVSRALLVVDPRVDLSLVDFGDVEVVRFDGVRVEPTLDSLQEAADFALDAGVDGFVSVGGGSDDRHRQGRFADRLPPRAGDGLRQRRRSGAGRSRPGRCCRTWLSRPRRGRGARRRPSRSWTSRIGG